jgi:hypothetical protein
MKSMLELLVSATVMLCLSGVGGCAAGDEGPGGAGTESREQAAEVGGEAREGLTSVDMVDCSICEIAKTCCRAVSAASYCDNFNAQRCATLDPGRQRTTKLNCLVQLRTTISAWRLAGRTPPAACYIPGE